MAQMQYRTLPSLGPIIARWRSTLRSLPNGPSAVVHARESGSKLVMVDADALRTCLACGMWRMLPMLHHEKHDSMPIL